MEKKMGKKWSLKEYGKNVMRELLKEPGKKDEGKLTRLEDLKMDDLKSPEQGKQKSSPAS
jgi:hypothetical protein